MGQDVLFVFAIKCLSIFNFGKIHLKFTILTFLSIHFSSVKYIHVVV